MTEPLKGAMVGAGFFAQFHADGWNRSSSARIVAVADPLAGRTAEFASRWRIPATYANVEEMLEKERPDFVDIVTRPDTHLPLVRLAAEHRIPVICQKPMAPTMKDCQEMVVACRAANLRLVIHENWRWQPWYREIKRLCDVGRLGRPFHLGFRMRTGDGRGPEAYPTQPYFREMPRLLLFETAVHFLDTFRFLAGDIEAVFCRTQQLNPSIQGEDYALVQVRFAEGGNGLIDANRISGTPPPKVAFGEFVLEGALGHVRMTQEGDLWIAEHGRQEVAHPFAKAEIGYKGDSVKAMQEHFVSCLKSGKPAESEGQDYLQTVATVEACYRSNESGKEEKVQWI